MINEQRLVDYLLDIIRINSESGDELAMSQRLEADLKAIPGVTVRTETVADYDTNGYNIIAEFPGTVPGDTILLSSHQDTVKPGLDIRPVIEGRTIKSGGDTILAADDKAGIAEIMEVLRVLAEDRIPHRSLEIVFSAGEEVGLCGAKSLDTSRLKAKVGFVLDIAGNAGRVIHTQPGSYHIAADIYGRKAHAGNCPEKGISAIMAAAEASTNMHLLRIDEETTANIGTFKAEYASNIVAEHVHLLGEIRSRSAEKLEAEVQHMEKCLQDACDKVGARLEFSKKLMFGGYKLPADCTAVEMYRKAAAKHGVELTCEGAGGCSDSNVYNARGIQCIVVATGDADNHTAHETCNIDTMNKCAAILLDLVTAE